MRLLHKRAVILLQARVPPLSERQILRAVQIPRLQSVVEIEERGVREAVLKAAARAAQMSSFEAVFRSVEIERRSEKAVVVLGSETLLAAPSLLELLREARLVTLMAVTLGPVWDAALDDLCARGEAAEAWFLDAIGTKMADQAARAVEDRAAGDLAREGFRRTRRYRPGYGDWSVEVQAELCGFVEAHRIGVCPNEASMLVPHKSITGVLGFRESDESEQDPG
jgi:hypothetical protein